MILLDKYVGSCIVAGLGFLFIILGTLLGLDPVSNSGWISLVLGAILLYMEWQNITISLTTNEPGLLKTMWNYLKSLFSTSASSPVISPSSLSVSSRLGPHPNPSAALEASQGGINAVKFLLSGLLFIMGVTMALGGSILCLVMFALALLFFVDVKKTEQRLMDALMYKKR